MKGKGLLEFGPFRADLHAQLLTRDGQVVPLPPKAFEVLQVLLTSDGQGVTREQLLTAVWGDALVEEGNLTQAISVLRKALGDEVRQPQYIVTIPRRGYRFGTSIRELPDLSEPAKVDGSAGCEPASPGKARWRVPKRLIGMATVMILAAIAFYFAVRPKAPAVIRSLVVLPLVNLSPQPEQEYVADGLTEEITNALALTPGLKVVARTSAFQYKGKNVDIRTIGATLGVDAVLEGSVRLDGTRLRVTAQLNSSRDGFHYWSHTWEHGMKDVFNVEQEIAHEVVAALGQSNGTPVPQLKPLTQSLEAHNFYLQGQYFKEHILEGMLPRAVEAFDAALKEDPGFAAAHAQIGQAYSWATQLGKVPAQEGVAVIRDRARRALDLDPNLALGHALQADISFFWEWNFPAAERSFRRAIELDPIDTGARHEFSHYLLAMGRFKEAETEARRLTELDPVSIDALTHLQLHFVFARDIPHAISAGERALTVDPRSSDALRFLQWTYEASGQYQKAIETAARRTDLAPETAPSLQAGFRREGEIGYWKASHESRLRELKDESARAWEFGSFYARLGQKKQALQSLAKAVDLHYTNAVYLNVSGEFDSLRSLPEFQRLVRRIGLPEP